MSKILNKKESEELIQRWLDEDKTLDINERVFVIEKFLRNLITEPEIQSDSK